MHSRTILNKLTLLSLLWFSQAGACLAAMSADSSDSVSLDMSGTIEPMCKVRNNVKTRSLRLDLTSNKAQNTNNVFIWCNTGQNNASATYSSLNNGFLVNEHNQTIPYLLTVANTARNLSLISPKTVSQRAGSGTKGKDKGRVIKIEPQVNGFEYAGTYRDTISVTVSFD